MFWNKSKESRPLVEQVVRDGVAVLDKAVPNWFTRIDTETLDLDSSQACILGQLFGDYSEGMTYMMDRHGLKVFDDDWALRHGFLTGCLEEGRVFPLRLKQEWITVIGARLDPKKEHVLVA